MNLACRVRLSALAWIAPIACAIGAGEPAQPLAWLPADLPAPPAEGPMLCRRDYLTPVQGAALLEATQQHFREPAAWRAYAATVRQKIQSGAGLEPWPERTPLHAIVRDRREHDGYSVENVALETFPGVYACGNLYRPLQPHGQMPAVLATHGHTAGVKTPADWARHGRFHEGVQKRAAILARLGAVVLTVDLFAYGDSLIQFGAEAHARPESMTFQLWNNERALDFLASLPDVDPRRIAVTGESGGATEALLLTALDERIAVSVPVVMVSSYFFGGCPCESGRPIHRSAGHFASNAVIAALAAPRPMLVVSDGGDWTKYTPDVEYPFLRAMYRLLDAENAVESVHLAKEGHDYGPSKRAAMYRFLGTKLALSGVGEPGAFDESVVTIETPDAMRLFANAEALPNNACRTVEAAMASLQSLQKTK